MSDSNLKGSPIEKHTEKYKVAADHKIMLVSPYFEETLLQRESKLHKNAEILII